MIWFLRTCECVYQTALFVRNESAASSYVTIQQNPSSPTYILKASITLLFPFSLLPFSLREFSYLKLSLSLRTVVMSDEEHHFESKADAGASKTYPQQAGTIRKNGYIVIKSRPCKVSSDSGALILFLIFRSGFSCRSVFVRRCMWRFHFYYFVISIWGFICFVFNLWLYSRLLIVFSFVFPYPGVFSTCDFMGVDRVLQFYYQLISS